MTRSGHNRSQRGYPVDQARFEPSFQVFQGFRYTRERSEWLEIMKIIDGFRIHQRPESPLFSLLFPFHLSLSYLSGLGAVVSLFISVSYRNTSQKHTCLSSGITIIMEEGAAAADTDSCYSSCNEHTSEQQQKTEWGSRERAEAERIEQMVHWVLDELQ